LSPHSKDNVPAHVAIIMDGNGRWAEKKRLPRFAGHRAGVQALKRTVAACEDLKIKHLTVYAFSTENWGRPRGEIDKLLSLFSETIDGELKQLERRGIRIRFLGRLSDFPKELQAKMESVSESTRGNSGLNLNIMVSYGGRAEIVEAAARASGEEISEGSISRNLYTAGIPDPDLLIRTANERRVSNFLLWQIAYSELYFSKLLWPDFDRAELVRALADYQKRERRFGKV